MSIDVNAFVPAAPKDYNKLKFVLWGIDRNARQVQTVHICTPTPVDIGYSGRLTVFQHRDQDVLAVDPHLFKYRPFWVYSCLLKLLQRVTSDWYWVLDADRIVMQPISLFTEFGDPVFIFGRDQHHEPYFEFNRRVFGFGKTFDYSFISEMTLYSQHLVDEMLSESGYSRETFIEKVIKTVDGGCYPAESEVYGNWIMLRHPALYRLWQVNESMNGKYGEEYSDREIRELIDAHMDDPTCQTMSIHSWKDREE